MVRVNLEIVLPAIGINGARGKFGSAFAARVVNVLVNEPPALYIAPSAFSISGVQ